MSKRLLVSTEEAEDATQEVIAKLWSRRDAFAQWQNVEAMALKMTRNYCLDQLKARRSGNLRIEEQPYTDRSAGADRIAEASDVLRWVERIINQLPEQQRAIIQLRDVEELDFDEIAEALNMTPVAVRVALSRARKYIREKMIQTHHYGTGH